MGKQLNYWMEYDSFLLITQKAVDLGCTIVKEDPDSGKVTESRDVGIVTPVLHRYYFHLPEAGDIKLRTVNGTERLDGNYSATGNAVIHAGYSAIVNEPAEVCGKQQKRLIRRARVYCITGYYDEKGEYIPRPECLTKVYNSLVRYVKKIAPYTELSDVLVSIRDENYGEEYEYKHKEYITKTCLDMRNNKGYQLVM